MSTAILLPTSNSTPTYDSVVETPQSQQQQQQQQQKQQQQQQQQNQNQHQSLTAIGTDENGHTLSETTNSNSTALSSGLTSTSTSASVSALTNDDAISRSTEKMINTTDHDESQTASLSLSLSSDSEVAAVPVAIATATDANPPMTKTPTGTTTGEAMSHSDAANENDCYFDCSSHTNNNGSICNALVADNTDNSDHTDTVTVTVKTTTTTTTTNNSSNALVLYNSSTCSPNPETVTMNDTTTSTTSTPTSTTTTKYKGLPNLGNSCYLNSAIQMLYSVDSFASHLIDQYSTTTAITSTSTSPGTSTYADANVENDKNTNTVDENENGNGHNGSGSSDGGDADDNKNDNNLNVTNNLIIDSNSNGNSNSNNQTKKDEELAASFPLHCALANLFSSMRSNTDANETTNTNTTLPLSPSTSTSTSTPLSFLSSFTTSPTATATATTTTTVTTGSTNGVGNAEITNNNNSNSSSSISNEVVVPFSSMQQFKNTVDLHMPQFAGYWQQDSHEFLSTLLDLLHDEVVNYHKKKKEEEEEEQKEKEDTFHNDDVMVEKDGEGDDDDEVEKMDVDNSDYKTDLVTIGASATAAAAVDTLEGQKQQVEQKENGVVEKDGYVIVNSQHQHSNKKARLTTDGENCTSARKEEEEHHNKLGEDSYSDADAQIDDADTDVNVSDNDNDAMTKVPSFSNLKLEEISVLLHGSAKDSEKIGMERQPLQKGRQHFQGRRNSCNGSATSTHNINCNVKKLIGGRISYDGIKNSSTPSSPLIELKMTNGPIFMEDITLEPQQHEESSSSFHAMDTKEDNDIDNDNGDSTDSQNQIQQQSNSNTLVDTFFTMEVRTCLTCDSCNFSRSRKETFRHLSIEVGDVDDESPSTSTIASLHQNHYDRTVQEGIRKFFSDEKLELKCEKCFGESATQSMEIVRLPRVLLLHLKRFIVDVSPDYTRVSYRKNRAAVEFDEHLSLDQEEALGEFLATDVSFPAVLDESKKDEISLGERDECDNNDEDDYEILEPIDGELEGDGDDDDDDDTIDREGFVDLGMMKRKFKIRSVINHIGSSASCGHYTANAFKLNKKENKRKDGSREWLKFNDSFVSNISKEEAMGEQTQKSAYLLMYEFE